MAGELQSLLDETRRPGREPEAEQQGGPERTTARGEAGLEELKNYQSAQIRLAFSSQLNLKEQLEAITSSTEQANQMLLTSLQRLEDSGDRQNEASRKVILSGYKAFEESVEQTASRNETQLRKMHDEQRRVNERPLRLQSEQKSRLDSLAHNVHGTSTRPWPHSIDRPASRSDE